MSTNTGEKETAGQAAPKMRQVTGQVVQPAQLAARRATDTAKQAASKVRQRPARFAGAMAVPAAAAAAVMVMRRRRAAKARTRRWPR